jgi:hypothetical protein
MALNLADKTGVLAELWINFREDPQFSTFIDYNDIGLPMAYFMAEGLVNGLTPLGEQYITESFDMFCTAMEVSESELESLEQINLNSIVSLVQQRKAKEE